MNTKNSKQTAPAPKADAPPTAPEAPATIVTKTIDEALVVAQRIAESVGIDKKNLNFNYRYASAEAIMAEARAALSEAGLSLSPAPSGESGHAWCLVRMDPVFEMEVTTKSGQKTLHRIPAMLHRSLRLAHVLGESRLIDVEWPVIPEVGRPFDKALASALTASMAYVLRDLLLLPRVEKGTGLDDERNHGDGSGREQHDEPPEEKVQWRTNDQAQAIVELFSQLGVAGPDQRAYALAALGDGVDGRLFVNAAKLIGILHDRAEMKAREAEAAKSNATPPPAVPPSAPATGADPAKDAPLASAPPPSSESPSDGTTKPTSVPTPTGEKPKTATETLLTFKQSCDNMRDEPSLDGMLAMWAPTLKKLPPGALKIADGYARAVRAGILKMAPEAGDAELAAQLNELAKE